MNAPTFQSSEHHHAFKQGYRAALLNRPLHAMPSYIRQRADLRQLFEQGWQEAKDELTAGTLYHKRPYLRHRVTWIVMTAIAGIATAALMIDDIRFFSATSVSTIPVASTLNKPTPTDEADFSLLDPEQRRSLTALRNTIDNSAQPSTIPTQSLVDSHIAVTQTLSAASHPELDLDRNTVIPKYVRSLNLSLTIHNATTPLTLRWTWRNQLIHSEILSQSQLSQPISRQISLFSAGIGIWQIELLDPSGNVVYRYEFNYINQLGS
ncbi:MAG: hypothetical protein WCS28_10340 [Thiomicrospira sp.]